MRTSKNVRVRQGGGRIFYQSALLCPQQKSLSLLLLMDMMQISYRSKKDKTEKKKKKREIEESKEMSKAAGKVNT